MIEPTINDYSRILAFINIYGIDKFNVKGINLICPELLSIISGHLGGFKKIKQMIESGELTVTPMSNSTVKADISETLEVSEHVDVSSTFNSNLKTNPTLESQGVDVFKSFMGLLTNIESRLNDIDNKVDNLSVSHEDSENLPNMAIPTQMLNSPLDVKTYFKSLGIKPVFGLRDKVHDNVIKYVRYMNKEKKLDTAMFGVAIRKTYNKFYDLLLDSVGIKSAENKETMSMEAIRVGFLNLENLERKAIGKKQLEISDKEIKGFSKIDIVEKLGLIDMMYYLTIQKLKEIIPVISLPEVEREEHQEEGVS